MWLRRIRGNLEELRQECVEAAREEEEASFALTRSARAFSHQTKEVAEDKLSFSATLMRAGEVHAANRLIEEFEADVKAGEAALIEQMNEIEMARVNRRTKMTRLRLVRTMAVAMLGACVMAFSAAGIAVAGFVADLQESGDPVAAATGVEVPEGATVAQVDPAETRLRSIKRVRLPNGKRLRLSALEYARYQRLTEGDVDQPGLESFLAGLIGPELAAQVTQTIATAGETVNAAAAQSVEGLPELDAPEPAKKKKAKVDNKADKKASAKKSDPEPKPTPPEDEQPTPDPTGTGGEDGGPNSALPTDGDLGG